MHDDRFDRDVDPGMGSIKRDRRKSKNYNCDHIGSGYLYIFYKYVIGQILSMNSAAELL